MTGTPIDLARLIDVGHPLRRASYELKEQGRPTVSDVLEPIIVRGHGRP